MSVREPLALLLAAASFGAALRVARAAGRQPLALSMPVALAVLVAWECLLLNLLSYGRLVTPVVVTAIHVFAIAGVLAFVGGREPTWRGTLDRRCREVRDGLRRLGATLRPRGLLWALVPLVVMLAVSAVVYPPSNWDSMTYHMARVAHWMQNQSIRYYPTFVQRQNEMAPGAEYLILLLQLGAGTDRWANLVQCFAYVVAVVGAGGLLRAAGLPRRLAVYAQLFVASLPMAVLQAATTQNDLVAAVMSLAIASASLPFLRRSPRRWAPRHVLLLAVCVAAGMLVKPTSVLAVIFVPLLGAATVAAALPRLRRPEIVRLARAAGAATLLMAVLLVPDYTRRRAATGSAFGRPHAIVPSDTPWRDRLANVVAAHCQSALLPEPTRVVLERITAGLATDGQPPPLYCLWVYAPHEDVAGNPFQAAVTLALLPGLLLLVRGGGLRRLLALVPAVGWVAVHVKLSNQGWLSRLQLPLFVLSPLAWLPWMAPAAGWLERVRARVARVLSPALGAAAMGCLCYAYVVVANVRERPLLAPRLVSVLRDREAHYYVFRPQVAPGQQETLEVLARTGCRRLGLLIGEDTYDYPLTWRAMRAGVAVRHYVASSAWPCAIHTDSGPPAGEGWRQAASHTWIREPPP